MRNLHGSIENNRVLVNFLAEILHFLVLIILLEGKNLCQLNAIGVLEFYVLGFEQVKVVDKLNEHCLILRRPDVVLHLQNPLYFCFF